jgi:hypothetical protein
VREPTLARSSSGMGAGKTKGRQGERIGTQSRTPRRKQSLRRSSAGLAAFWRQHQMMRLSNLNSLGAWVVLAVLRDLLPHTGEQLP